MQNAASTTKVPVLQIVPSDLDFQPAEWAEEGQNIQAAYVEGFEVIVEETEDGKGFTWQVRATSEISETPELIADSHSYGYLNRGFRQAVRMILVVLNREIRIRAKARQKAEREAAKAAESQLSETEQETLQTAVDVLNGERPVEDLQEALGIAVDRAERIAELEQQREAASGQAKAALTRRIKQLKAETPASA